MEQVWNDQKENCPYQDLGISSKRPALKKVGLSGATCLHGDT